MVKGIIIEIAGTRYEMTLEEARTIKQDLDSIFNEPTQINVPFVQTPWTIGAQDYSDQYWRSTNFFTSGEVSIAKQRRNERKIFKGEVPLV